MIELSDNPVQIGRSRSSAAPRPPSPRLTISSTTPSPAPVPPLARSQSTVQRPTSDVVRSKTSPSRLRPPPFRLILRPQPNQADLVSKINLLDLATEITAVIFRYAHKPKDFHYLLPSGAGPLIPRKYNLPLTVSKEWYRRVRPIYYETLRLTWTGIPEFTENIQRYDSLPCYIRSVHIKIRGNTFYKTINHQGSRRGGEETHKFTAAQLWLLVGQYIEYPLATFALCLDSLICVRDLTLRFTECKGGEVSLQSILPLSWTV